MTTELDQLVSRMNAGKCHWDDVIDVIQINEFGFCGCGLPKENILYVMNGLAHINEERPDNIDHSEWFDGWKKHGIEVFGNEASMYFFFYWADKEGLTEHGSSVPGWLTDKGEALLAALRQLEVDGAFGG